MSVIARSVRRSLVLAVVNNVVTRMSSTKLSYEDAVHKLNLLQSNKASLDQIRRDLKAGRTTCTNIQDMENYLLRTGVSLALLDKLSVVHVAGTKGKGSTSAMCESILRQHGYRTGFYSSPHLVAVRERIRLAGDMLTEEQFAKHFHTVYDALHSSQAYDGDMPKYFAFLTVLAYNVFLREEVDVAIVEVGIGGVVDYTNVLRKVPIVGITALGLDHTSILGNTLAEIAAAKAGIMKAGCQAYTVQQPPEAMQVLQRVASDVQCPLRISPDFRTYKHSNGQKILPIDLEAYQTNASLAVQLAHAWMRHTVHSKKVITNKANHDDQAVNGADASDSSHVVTTLPHKTLRGLKECRWPGRYQVIRTQNAHFYLDGAHTKESMEICVKWFQESKGDCEKILIFSATGDRDVEMLLKPLRNITFKTIFFVIPTAYKCINKHDDNYSTMEQKDLLAKCHNNANIWKNYDSDCGDINIVVMECVSDALLSIKKENSVSVLITGSLHLVGAALSIINPSLS